MLCKFLRWVCSYLLLIFIVNEKVASVVGIDYKSRGLVAGFSFGALRS